MDLSDAVLGKHIADQLRERTTAPILRIGRDTFTRAQLAGVACFNFIAAQNLSAVLNSELQVTDTRDVFNTVAPSAIAVPRVGAIAIAVLGAAFEVRGLGGDAPLENWVRKHTEKDAPLVTFGTFKHHHTPPRRPARRGRRVNGRKGS